MTKQDAHAAADPISEDPDLMHLARHLGPAERDRLNVIDEYAQRNIRRQSLEPWNDDRLPLDMLAGLGSIGLGELHLDGSSPLLRGLAHTALARADVSISAVIGIHNELIVGMIQALGSERQREEWLPALRRLRAFGAFCLTEPEHGSDVAGGLATSATLRGGQWRIQGSKRWIGMGTVADVALVWARDTADGQVKGFLVPTSCAGYQARKITHKTGLRIMPNADIELDVTLPQDALLPGATSFTATNTGLRSSRAWVGWQAVGAQQALLDIARDYAKRRDQFGAPLASFQLVQAALAKVAGNLAVSTSFMAELTRLQSDRELTMMHASLGKATLTRLARESAAAAREIFGGNGILSDHEAAKIAGDIEAIYTYEGSHGINLLIAGRELTGVSAFA
ncbi:acyl-CoA dehydrogenase family protein [Nesterenkonia sp. LB17]|uniref:acyl-CoA dehydrogenase family protein n=1 Tax=unclassified Nesterenkonia TaxID=2629769 RepID=UPI001F4C634F|nr:MULTISPECIES: acyl-CoA dehydrogenase family protein [unclassified Nesterenkonia]MCH8562973.1 acyl-CoA dehydrogenase family protein [Nesterenkonia sp. YGD6]MCH8566011.1 acyl-CoA dehydrogenase family protein [Nesterenkonia sp. LB17]